MDTIIAKYGMDDPCMVYNNVNNIEDLIEAYVGYFEGKVNQSLCKLAPFSHDNMGNMDKILNVTRHGFIINTIEFASPVKDEYKNNLWIRYEAKDMICGYMPNAYVQKFIPFMEHYGNSLYYSIISTKSPVVLTYSTFPHTRYITSRVKLACNQENLDDEAISEWKAEMEVDYSRPENWMYVCNGYDKIKKMFEEDFVYVEIVGHEYGKNCIVDILCDFFKST